jgi:hypothetical protein
VVAHTSVVCTVVYQPALVRLYTHLDIYWALLSRRHRVCIWGLYNKSAASYSPPTLPGTMARTRSKGGAAPTSKSQALSSESQYTLSPASSNPPKIFILPTKATTEARVVSLLNPRLARPTRYLVCPETGFYEFTKIAAPKSTPRSWLIQCNAEKEVEKGEKAAPSSDVATKKQTEKEEQKKGEDDNDEYGAYITKGADLYIATPVDPVFLLLPALTGEAASSSDEDSSRSRDEKKQLFLSLDDHLDSITQSASPHLAEIMRRWCGYGAGSSAATPTPLRALLEARADAVCDVVPAGDETMYRVSEPRVLGELLTKARQTAAAALPRSMEERFVTKVLEAPVLGVKRVPGGGAESGASTPAAPVESQSSVSSTETAATGVSDASTAATSVTEESQQKDEPELELKPAIVASPEAVALQRLRITFSYLLSSYVSPSLATRLRTLLESPDVDDAKKLKKALAEPIDFKPLDDYLAQLTQVRREAAASRSTGDFSRKRTTDEEEIAGRAEKKRKKEEEEKRKKAGQSRGVKNLGKVNTTGMKKMSDFFKKK